MQQVMQEQITHMRQVHHEALDQADIVYHGFEHVQPENIAPRVVGMQGGLTLALRTRRERNHCPGEAITRPLDRLLVRYTLVEIVRGDLIAASLARTHPGEDARITYL